MNKIESSYSVAHLKVGKCQEGEELAECSGGGNHLGNDQGRYCHTDREASITIECDQQSDIYSSCNISK